MKRYVNLDVTMVKQFGEVMIFSTNNGFRVNFMFLILLLLYSVKIFFVILINNMPVDYGHPLPKIETFSDDGGATV